MTEAIYRERILVKNGFFIHKQVELRGDRLFMRMKKRSIDRLGF